MSTTTQPTAAEIVDRIQRAGNHDTLGLYALYRLIGACEHHQRRHTAEGDAARWTLEMLAHALDAEGAR